MKQPFQAQQNHIEAGSGEGDPLVFPALDVNIEAAMEWADPVSTIPLLPEEPMAPISDNNVPIGKDWGYQLKWDGVRILARIHAHGKVELYSRRLYLKNTIYSEITSLLEENAPSLGSCLLDGEVVWWDGIRVNFQQVLKRERSRGLSRQSLSQQHQQQMEAPIGPSGGLVYVLFDLLADHTGDIRNLPYQERYRRLTALCPSDNTRLFVTDLFDDGQALWDWVEANHWEGIVSKKLSSTYKEGKKHRDWLKKKTNLVLDIDIVGLKWRNGIIASLVMEYDGDYLGSVSLGLNDALRRVLATTFVTEQSRKEIVPCPFNTIPEELKREHIQWLPLSFKCRVSGLERTSAGQLRHPKLVTFLPKEPLT
ncbi:hypothetical protein Back11_58630 [Paenibacillus baekrokdamisoli]|uniref:Uncharacterized protein n=1 Tax=Paenibacillus baekrokdamisoli TaxID=1712516 RepID=A0A3G9JK72_9BACL|nr:DNA ligase [Paenibacillus baekrokdamisoli]MBB3071451.1 bifunctional non-homologous end joining protein LigD [Paenibacillus baekrokdamisoli]BBH24518.1 hypothetical protein Back11_58630 [Paenibacillus baekrokdamisoli]